MWFQYWPSDDVHVGVSVLLEESVCYDQRVLLPCFILYSKAKLACYSRYLLTSYFCILVPHDEKDIFVCVCVLVLRGLVGLHRTVQLQLLQHFWLRHRLELLWYWMVCPWKQTETILSFLKLHPSTAFLILLLTMMAAPFLLRDSCPQ